jgi:hypothetical protein
VVSKLVSQPGAAVQSPKPELQLTFWHTPPEEQEAVALGSEQEAPVLGVVPQTLPEQVASRQALPGVGHCETPVHSTHCPLVQ